MAEESGQAPSPKPKPTKSYPGASALHRSPDGGFTKDSQQAGTINNAARDQYLSYYYALRIEPLRRRARVLFRAGLAALLVAPLLVLPGSALLDAVSAIVALAGVALMLASLSIRRRALRAEVRL